MPRPWIRCLILAFWLSTTVSLLWVKTVRPLLRSHEPPPVSIDLVDEAQRGPQEIHWSVRHIHGTGAGQQVETFRGISSIRYHAEDDTFELRVRLSRAFVGEANETGGAFVPIKSMESVQY